MIKTTLAHYDTCCIPYAAYGMDHITCSGIGATESFALLLRNFFWFEPFRKSFDPNALFQYLNAPFQSALLSIPKIVLSNGVMVLDISLRTFPFVSSTSDGGLISTTSHLFVSFFPVGLFISVGFSGNNYSLYESI